MASRKRASSTRRPSRPLKTMVSELPPLEVAGGISSRMSVIARPDSDELIEPCPLSLPPWASATPEIASSTAEKSSTSQRRR